MAEPTTREPELSDTDRVPPEDASAAVGSVRRRVIDWRPIFLEAFFVVLGVVLALAANEWRQSMVDRRAATTALETIRQELATNRAAVLRSLRYHLYLSDTLSALRRQATTSSTESSALPDVRLFREGFVRPATLLSTAWQAAAATEAVRNIDHEDVLVLAGIYKQQRRYATQSEQIGALIYGEIFARGTSGMIRNFANLTSIIGAFWYRECDLLLAYDRALAELRGAAAAADVPETCRRGARQN
jgi:hypothetical protein